MMSEQEATERLTRLQERIGQCLEALANSKGCESIHSTLERRIEDMESAMVESPTT